MPHKIPPPPPKNLPSVNHRYKHDQGLKSFDTFIEKVQAISIDGKIVFGIFSIDLIKDDHPTLHKEILEQKMKDAHLEYIDFRIDAEDSILSKRKTFVLIYQIKQKETS